MFPELGAAPLAGVVAVLLLGFVLGVGQYKDFSLFHRQSHNILLYTLITFPGVPLLRAPNSPMKSNVSNFYFIDYTSVVKSKNVCLALDPKDLLLSLWKKCDSFIFYISA